MKGYEQIRQRKHLMSGNHKQKKQHNVIKTPEDLAAINAAIDKRERKRMKRLGDKTMGGMQA
jgi:hypothetical protein